ncbi:MAG: 6-bladed beta-propeller [Gemmatimonadota bacterium]
MIRRVVLAASVLCLAGCRSEPERPRTQPWKGTVDTLAGGTVRVTNPTEGIWTEADRWHFVAERRIGGADSGAFSFGEIVGVAPAPSGDIVVADGATQEIRLFDASGRYLNTLGHKGKGPGEFADIIGLAWDPDARLWVADAGNSRYIAFRATGGDTLRTIPRRVPGALHPWVAGFGDDLNLYDAGAEPRADGGTDFAFYRIDPLMGTLFAKLPPLTYRVARTALNGNAAPPVLSALIPRFTFAFGPNRYLWFGTTDRYEITQRTWLGDTVRIINMETQPISVTDAEKDSISQELTRTARLYARPWGRSDIPSVKPAFVRIFTGPDSTVIVQPSASPADEGRIFDVFDSSGRYLGRATSDVAFITYPVRPVFTEEFVYGVTATKTGAQQVVRARIYRGPGR